MRATAGKCTILAGSGAGPACSTSSCCVMTLPFGMLQSYRRMGIPWSVGLGGCRYLRQDFTKAPGCCAETRRQSTVMRSAHSDDGYCAIGTKYVGREFEDALNGSARAFLQPNWKAVAGFPCRLKIPTAPPLKNLWSPTPHCTFRLPGCR